MFVMSQTDNVKRTRGPTTCQLWWPHAAVLFGPQARKCNRYSFVDAVVCGTSHVAWHVWLCTLASCAKADGTIVMPFGVHSRVGWKKLVLDHTVGTGISEGTFTGLLRCLLVCSRWVHSRWLQRRVCGSDMALCQITLDTCWLLLWLCWQSIIRPSQPLERLNRCPVKPVLVKRG